MTLVLPFKPFTQSEVAEITKAPTALIDKWYNTLLPERVGEDKFSRGLDYMQTFALFVGHRWLFEGSGPDRAQLVVSCVASMTLQTLEGLFAEGLTFPVFTPQGATIGRAPMHLALGRRLNLKTLYQTFRGQLEQVFRR